MCNHGTGERDLPAVYASNIHEWRLLFLTGLFYHAGVLGIHMFNETLVPFEEIIDLPVLGVWDVVIGMGLLMGESSCHRKQ
jgi:hypothetical protein